MADLKLGKLPDRNPVKLTITLSPDLYAALTDYACVYEAVYGTREIVVDLVPAMLSAFLESDRGFAKALRGADPVP